MARRWWWAAAGSLLLLSCGPARNVPDCKAVCGLRYDGDDCEGFQKATERVLAVYSEHQADACKRFDDWIIYRIQTDGGSWTDFWGRQVAGLTFCHTMSVEIGSEEWSNNAFAHEMMHALECPIENTAHAGWDAWQWDAIKAASNSDNMAGK
jgi:hypothetical protein